VTPAAKPSAAPDTLCAATLAASAATVAEETANFMLAGKDGEVEEGSECGGWRRSNDLLSWIYVYDLL
jgi:hypothetical protein